MRPARPHLHPIAEWAPWTDRRGRLDPLRAAVFALLLLPAGWLAVRGWLNMLGARPLNAAIHVTGYWAAWIFMASLIVSPAKALLGTPNIVVVRRMIGVSAACYAGVHLLLYAADQNWRPLAIVTEILVRAYLTIGFVTLLGLTALAVTSTDGWVKRLGRNWKRLHKLAYGFGVLALIHFFLQSKADVSQATIAAGVFAWAMIWRMLPAGRDRGPVPLIGLAFAAALAALAFEWAWYRFATNVDPLRVVRAEFDPTFGLHPAGKVLLLGLLAAGVAELRNLAQTRFGAGPGFAVLVYALGGLVGWGTGLALGWSMEDLLPEGTSIGMLTIASVLLFALLGLARHRLRVAWQRRLLDMLWVGAALLPVLQMGFESREVGMYDAALLGAGALVLAARLWNASPAAAALLVPFAGLAAYQAFGPF